MIDPSLPCGFPEQSLIVRMLWLTGDPKLLCSAESCAAASVCMKNTTASAQRGRMCRDAGIVGAELQLAPPCISKEGRTCTVVVLCEQVHYMCYSISSISYHLLLII